MPTRENRPTPAPASRKGRKIARRACDFCRDRRVQCTFEQSDSPSCRHCLKSRTPCTFLTQRKPRGPRRSQYEPAVINAAFVLANTGANSEGDAAPGHQAATPATSTVTVIASSIPTSETSLAATTGGPQAVTTGPAPLPIGLPSVEHLVPEPIFRVILDEYIARVYPVIPLVHLPTFLDRLHERDFVTDPAFFRLCMAICAVTVASIPRNGGTYGAPWYRKNNVSEMVDRAAHLILLSSMSAAPVWKNKATVESILVNVIMALAFHYSGRNIAGWAYESDAVLAFRAMELYKKESYAELNTVDAEMCKRAFWLLFIMQIHDRMSHAIPHTGLNYDPKNTDWEFLLPLDISDEALISPIFTRHAGSNSTACNPGTDSSGHSSVGSSSSDTPPTISGFIALVKVFLCAADLLDIVFPGLPAQFSLSPGSHALQSILPEHDASLFGFSFSPESSSNYFYSYCPPFSTFPSYAHLQQPFLASNWPRSQLDVTGLDSLFQVMARLNSVLNTLPDELRPIRTAEDSQRAALSPEDVPSRFKIMRANVQITSIYIQSMIIETCLAKLQNPISSFAYVRNLGEGDLAYPQAPHDHAQIYQEWDGRAKGIDQASIQTTTASPETVAATSELRFRLWQLKDAVARELLEAVTSSPPWVLESNGSSMISKIREIAATLLEDGSDQSIASAAGGTSPGYLAQFVQILADLDHLSRHKA